MKKLVRFWKEFYEEVGVMPCAILGIMAMTVSLIIGITTCYFVSEASSTSDKQGTYTIEDDGEIQVYVNDKHYKYQIDPISGYVNLVDSHSSVTTNMTEKEFFKSLEDKGLKKEGD